MLSRICGTFHPLGPLYLKVCGLLCWNEGLDWNLWMSAFSNTNEIMWTVNWCNKSSELSCDVLLKAVEGCPSNHVVHWVDIIKGVAWQLLYYMVVIRASMNVAFIHYCYFLVLCCWSFGLFRLFVCSMHCGSRWRCAQNPYSNPYFNSLYNNNYSSCSQPYFLPVTP